jgi:hypothetical protein
MGTVQHNHDEINQPFSVMLREPSNVSTYNWPTGLTKGIMTTTMMMTMMMMLVVVDRNFSKSDKRNTGKVIWLPYKLPMILHKTFSV